MRKRREPLKWGASFLALLTELKSRQIKAIERECRRLLRELAAFSQGSESGWSQRIYFEMFDYGFVLQYDLAEEVWVLDVERLPTSKGRRARRPMIKAFGLRRSIQALPERVRPPRKKSLKRTLFDLYKTVGQAALGRALASFREMLAAFADDTSTMICANVALAAAVRCTAGVWNLVKAAFFTAREALGGRSRSMLGPCAADFHLERRWFGQEIGLAIVLSGYSPGGASDRPCAMPRPRERALESERFRV